MQTGLLPSYFLPETHILLEWLQDAGITYLVADEPFRPLQRFANQGDSPAQSTPESLSSPSVRSAPVSQTNWGALLADCTSLDQLNAWITAFRDLSLCRTASQAVLGTGQAAQPLIMVVAEAPDATEDQNGKAYSGAALNLLQQAFSHLPIPSDQVYLTYLSKWRPPGQRSLAVQELDLVQAVLQREIELVQPHHIILLGDPVFKAYSRMVGDTAVIAERPGDSAPKPPATGQRTARNPAAHKIYDIVFKQQNSKKGLLSLQKPETMLKDGLTKKRVWQGLLSFCQALPTSG